MVRPNIRQIEAFNAVMQGGSVTKAAETLFVSQPAVSKLIQAFEQSCGFSLFTRGQGRLLPTAEARRLFSETEKLMTGLDRIENTARAIRDSERGEIALVAFPALSSRLLPRAAAQFLADRPELQLTLMTRNSPDIPNSMLARAADCGISLLPTEEPGIVCKVFCEISLLCALPPGHRLATAPLVDIADLEGEQMVGLGRDDQSHKQVVEALARSGVRVDRRLDVQMADTACVLVSEGQGITVVPSVSALGWDDHELVFRPLRQRPRLVVWLYSSAWEPLPNLAHLLLETLKRVIREVEDQFYGSPSKGKGQS